jgi:hypothetical protein
VHGAGRPNRLLERKGQGTERGVTGAVGLHGKIQGRSSTKSHVTCVGRYRGRCCERSLDGQSLGQRCPGREGSSFGAFRKVGSISFSNLGSFLGSFAQ